MLYKINHYLFGWDYIIWSNSLSGGIERIITFQDGRIGYWQYRSMNIFQEIKNPKDVYWLTCHPSKYGFYD